MYQWSTLATVQLVLQMPRSAGDVAPPAFGKWAGVQPSVLVPLHSVPPLVTPAAAASLVWEEAVAALLGSVGCLLPET